MRIVILACALLLTSPARASWDSFQIIEWQPRNPAQWKTLHGLGVTAGAVVANRDGTGPSLDRQTAVLRDFGLGWYIENIATDFYASYHRYTPGRPVNWRFLAAQQRYRAAPEDPAALFREPSLLDPAWRARISERLIATVRQQAPFHPLYYSLGDETGIADLAAVSDFDLSPQSVAGFRTWLRGQYGSLVALNAEWGTAYAAWDAIQPETTWQTMRRTDDDFAAWNDFKAWMDTEFADALRFGTDAIHGADPHALSAIEGVQLPGWGGYDYARIAHAVDVMEIYDSDEDLPLIRSINPAVIPLITSFAAAPSDIHDIWRSVLRGARGLILWDEDNSIVRPDASPGPRATAYAAEFAALRGPIGRRLSHAEPLYDPVAILYSPASFRLSWLIDHRHDGDAWMDRTAENEWQDNAWRAALRGYSEALAQLGLHPRFITEAQLADGAPAVSVLILPHSIALSGQELQSIATFVAKRGQLIADVPPGQFDWHGRRRIAPNVPATIVSPEHLAAVLTLVPAVRVEAPNNDVETYLFRSDGRRLLALQRRTPRDTPETITVDLHAQQARDIATGRDYGRQDHLVLTLGPITPIFLELRR
ncbi:MAG TPA: beta-galactosidase [Acetobacteraceae bacterium]|nr:beta-galactosidase [Acetobacteraceae bacterium]